MSKWKLIGYFCKLEIKDVRKLKWIQLFTGQNWMKSCTSKIWNIVSKTYHSFFVTASIQNLCGLSEMKDENNDSG